MLFLKKYHNLKIFKFKKKAYQINLQLKLFKSFNELWYVILYEKFKKYYFKNYLYNLDDLDY